MVHLLYSLYGVDAPRNMSHSFDTLGSISLLIIPIDFSLASINTICTKQYLMFDCHCINY